MKKNTGPIFNEFEDATIAAFLALRGHTVTPLRNPNQPAGRHHGLCAGSQVRTGANIYPEDYVAKRRHV